MSIDSRKLEGINRDALQSFYVPPPDDLPTNARKLLEEYSKISPEDVLPHVVEVVRSRRWPSEPFFPLILTTSREVKHGKWY